MASIEDIRFAIADREAEMLEKFKKEKIIERELKIPKSSFSTDIANIITGPRRCGKSIFAFNHFRGSKFAYVNFDDERLNLRAEELNKVMEAIYSLKGEVEFIIFDEIQNVQGWERFISRLVQSKKIIITGSNAALMSKELATHLTGRHIDHKLLPFSFREFLEYRKDEIEGINPNTTSYRAAVSKLLEDYIDLGGFPLVLKTGKSFLLELYKDITEKDIIQRYKIRKASKLKEFARYLISNYSSEITYSKLRSILGINSTHTLQEWMMHIENSYLIFKIERFSFKLKERILAPKKIYSIDTGLAKMMGSSLPENKGRLMENLVAIELLRHRSYLSRQTEIYYWKNHQQDEVDFILKESNKIIELLQVTYANTKFEVKEREIHNLLKASKELNCKNLTIITWSYEDSIEENAKTIKFVPLWKWLASI